MCLREDQQYRLIAISTEEGDLYYCVVYGEYNILYQHSDYDIVDLMYETYINEQKE